MNNKWQGDLARTSAVAALAHYAKLEPSTDRYFGVQGLVSQGFQVLRKPMAD